MKTEIDDLIHQPVRTKIMAYLGNFGESDYTDIKNDLELSDGHMSTHMKKLVAARYVTVNKSFVKNKPKTRYKLSALGKKRLNSYLEDLKSLILGS